jgi:hypothetical protein
LLSFITNPVRSAASLCCVTTSSIALANHRSINTSSVCAMYCFLPLKIFPLGSVSIFLITTLNSIVDSALPCFKPHSVSNALLGCPQIFTLTSESSSVISTKFINFFGNPNSFKMYKYIPFIDLCVCSKWSCTCSTEVVR